MIETKSASCWLAGWGRWRRWMEEGWKYFLQNFVLSVGSRKVFSGHFRQNGEKSIAKIFAKVGKQIMLSQLHYKWPVDQRGPMRTRARHRSRREFNLNIWLIICLTIWLEFRQWTGPSIPLPPDADTWWVIRQLSKNLLRGF